MRAVNRSSRARHAQGIDDDVIHGDVGEPEPAQYSVGVASDAQVGAKCAAKLPRHHIPEIIRIETPPLQVNHQIIFRDHVDPAAAACHPRQLGDRPIRVWNSLQHMTAHDEVKRRVRQSELEDAPVFEAHA